MKRKENKKFIKTVLRAFFPISFCFVSLLSLSSCEWIEGLFQDSSHSSDHNYDFQENNLNGWENVDGFKTSTTSDDLREYYHITTPYYAVSDNDESTMQTVPFVLKENGRITFRAMARGDYNEFAKGKIELFKEDGTLIDQLELQYSNRSGEVTFCCRYEMDASRYLNTPLKLVVTNLGDGELIDGFLYFTELVLDSTLEASNGNLELEDRIWTKEYRSPIDEGYLDTFHYRPSYIPFDYFHELFMTENGYTLFLNKNGRLYVTYSEDLVYWAEPVSSLYPRRNYGEISKAENGYYAYYNNQAEDQLYRVYIGEEDRYESQELIESHFESYFVPYYLPSSEENKHFLIGSGNSLYAMDRNGNNTKLCKQNYFGIENPHYFSIKDNEGFTFDISMDGVQEESVYWTGCYYVAGNYDSENITFERIGENGKSYAIDHGCLRSPMFFEKDEKTYMIGNLSNEYNCFSIPVEVELKEDGRIKQKLYSPFYDQIENLSTLDSIFGDGSRITLPISGSKKYLKGTIHTSKQNGRTEAWRLEIQSGDHVLQLGAENNYELNTTTFSSETGEYVLLSYPWEEEYYGFSRDYTVVGAYFDRPLIEDAFDFEIVVDHEIIEIFLMDGMETFRYQFKNEGELSYHFYLNNGVSIDNLQCGDIIPF